MKNISKDLNDVFIASSVIILAVVAWGLVSMDSLANFALSANNWVAAHFDWFYIVIMNSCFVALLVLLLPRFKSFPLDKGLKGPEFSNTSWLAMLFTAGIGIGLLYYGVAEPLYHIANPPNGAPAHSKEAIELATSITLLHYGLHVWALYSLVGLGLIYYTSEYGLPTRISSLLYPIIGKRVSGPIGSLVDIIAIVAILFGVATTLGLGVQQINGGLEYLWGIPNDTFVQVGLIMSITLVATLSVVTGVDKGILLLSLGTMALSIALVVFVMAQSDLGNLLSDVARGGSQYVTNLIPLSLSQETLANTKWQQNWTTFYWAWWIAWAPFVGMFIARISRGRTLRQYIVGTMFAPAGFCGIWILVFAHQAMAVATSDGGALLTSVNTQFSVAFFQFLDGLPMSKVVSGMTLFLLIGFFVTSSDSGSLVVDMLASKGNPNPPVWQRVFWGLTEGFLAAILLLAGGLTALQAGSLVSTLPFGIIVLAVVVSLPIRLYKATK